IYFNILPLLATRAILDINYIVLIYSINIYSYYLNKLFFLIFFNFPSYKVYNYGLLTAILSTRRYYFISLLRT
ncbi:hypothetical protein CABS01_01463, partial [Colletotrichum abscissum]|uniref:uncharacterized protein n=1 Tax=Colletotrichum abscissum TaxID=1671311 RepID=UPI0027D58DA5